MHLGTHSKSLASIQQKALRFILGVGKACPIAGLFGVPYSMTLNFNILKFRKRIMKIDKGRIARKIFLWSEYLAGENYRNRAWKTKKLLESIGDFGAIN